MGFDKFYEARNIVEDIIQKDFIGPVEIGEIIEELPSKYYSMGILFPQAIDIEAVDQISSIESYIEGDKTSRDSVSGDSFEDVDQGTSLSNMYKPSSIAISTKVKPNIKEIIVNINYGKYILIERNIPDIDKISINNFILEKENEDNNQKQDKKNELKKDRWMRKEYSKEVKINIPDNKSSIKVNIEKGLSIEVFTHLIDKDNSKSITIALINNNIDKKDFKTNDSNSYFQVSMEISSNNKDDTIFKPKKILSNIRENEENESFSMLYSHIENYASGHGCSVEEVKDKHGCSKLISKSIASFELKQMEASVRVDQKLLEMYTLSTLNKEETINLLDKLVISYKSWIESQKEDLLNLDSRYVSSANKNIDNCVESISRISNGIKLLNDDIIFKSFQLVNESMLNQRKDFLTRNGKKFKDTDIKWYPFQLAFLLQEIESIVNTSSIHRKTVDLLWFPTGGGKTEAYLAISAFTIFYRRLKYKESGEGVSIIMRYTLRLLTMQQFERAAALICSCESLRKKYKLGGNEISIGLYVGSGMTPNYIKDAIKNIKLIKENGSKYVREGNPMQLLNCPVCGTRLSINEYKIKNNSMKVNCSNKKCEFFEGLPVHLIDEDIYKYKPTLILSTVDKFARLTWEPGVGKLFGIGTPYRAPELIIQDELHLISGPLGTVTGLFETAIDFLCQIDGVQTKVIASTATIKHAKSQIKSLYARDYRQFPPQGINIRDSYYANEAKPDIKPDRKYVGILSSHKTPSTTLIRLYASLQFATRYLIDLGFDDDVVDNYWTHIGYFNTLRELGGALVQVYDNVQERYLFLTETKFKNINPEFKGKRKYDNLMELTSRKKQSDITKALDDLSMTYKTTGAYDYVLASNMISVGIDFPRLGLMSIMGQPKSNSEYIQASSRVGRQNPGLIFTIYNPSRSRDRSHFEQFYEYHSQIYKHVEANSSTPFSSRARERTLSSVYISMCRHYIDELKNNTDANNFNLNDEKLIVIEDFIKNRAKIVIGDGESYKDLLTEIEQIKNEWKNAANILNLQYNQYGSNNPVPLLKITEEENGAFTTLNSMRNVDFQSNIFLEEE